MIARYFVQQSAALFLIIFFFFALAQFAHALVPRLCTGPHYTYSRTVALDKNTLPSEIVVESDGSATYLKNTGSKALVFKFPNGRIDRFVNGTVYSSLLNANGIWSAEYEIGARGVTTEVLVNDGPTIRIDNPLQLPSPREFSATLQYDNHPITIKGSVSYKLHQYDCAGKDIYNATSTTSAQAQIDALLQQIAQLQTQLAALRGQSTTSSGSSSQCLNLANALVIGSTDATTNGEVSKLQQFLIAAGVYPEARTTGYYGLLTAQAVVRWQKAHGMDFVTTRSGVGPMTRAKMTCDQKVAQCSTYDSKPVITSITPSSGPVGTTIEIIGCNFLGFESDKTLLFTNSKGERGLLYGGSDATTRTSNTVMRVTLPRTLCQNDNSYSGLPCSASLELVPGLYTVYSNSYGGNSNAVNFTVTATQGTQASSPSVTIISPNGGEQLKIGETYTVRWRASGIPSDARVQFTVETGRGRLSLSAGVLSDLNGEHSFQWTVPADYAMGDVVYRYPVLPGSDYRIRASIITPKNACPFLCRSDEPLARTLASDQSDGVLTISN